PEGEGALSRPAGAIHAFTLREGGLGEEVADAMTWLAEAEIPSQHRGLYESLAERVGRLTYGDGLPQALLHPDPVPKNFIASGRDVIAIDWTGGGRGPRTHALAFLLLAAIAESRWKLDSPKVDAVIAGYRTHVALADEEFAGLAEAMPLHVLVRDIAE